MGEGAQSCPFGSEQPGQGLCGHGRAWDSGQSGTAGPRQCNRDRLYSSCWEQTKSHGLCRNPIGQSASQQGVFLCLHFFGLVKMGKTVSQQGSGRAQNVAGQSFSHPGSCIPFLPYLSPLWSFPYDFDIPQWYLELCSTLWLVPPVARASGVLRLAERQEGRGLLSYSRIISRSDSVTTTAGGSALVLSQSLADKTLLSLQVKRWFF